jgi:hypothetical protein
MPLVVEQHKAPAAQQPPRHTCVFGQHVKPSLV